MIKKLLLIMVCVFLLAASMQGYEISKLTRVDIINNNGIVEVAKISFEYDYDKKVDLNGPYAGILLDKNNRTISYQRFDFKRDADSPSSYEYASLWFNTSINATGLAFFGDFGGSSVGGVCLESEEAIEGVCGEEFLTCCCDLHGGTSTAEILRGAFSNYRIAGGAIDYRYPAWRPDSKAVVYVSGSEWPYQESMYVIECEENDPNICEESDSHRMITPETTERLHYPSYSRDGTKIVYLSSEGQADVYRMDVWMMDCTQGTDTEKCDINDPRTRLTNAVEYMAALRGPKFNHDGTKIIYSAREDGDTEHDLYVMDCSNSIATWNCENSAPAPLLAIPGVQSSPESSPDGTKVVYSSGGGGLEVFEVWIMNADGSNRQQLTSDVGASYSAYPTFHPDGSKILYIHDDDQFWTMNLDGTGKTMITSASGPTIYDPSFSPDGSKIVYSTTGPTQGMYSVRIMNADGTDKQLITSTNYYSDVSFNFDGTKIIFVDDLDIYVANLDGSGRRRIVNNVDITRFPRFNSDGTQVIFSRSHSAEPGQDLFMMDCTDNDPDLCETSDGIVRLTDMDTYTTQAEWGVNDAEILFYADPNNEGGDLWRIGCVLGRIPNECDINDPSTQITNPYSQLNPMFSRDGTKIMYDSSEYGLGDYSGYLWMMDCTQGSNPDECEINDPNEQLLAIFQGDFEMSLGWYGLGLRQQDWSLDETAVIYGLSGAMIFFVDCTGGNNPFECDINDERIHLLSPAITGSSFKLSPSISPDGTKIVYTSRQDLEEVAGAYPAVPSDLWMLDFGSFSGDDCAVACKNAYGSIASGSCQAGPEVDACNDVEDPLAEYKFEETSGEITYDSSGNNHDGSQYGPLVNQPGQIGNSYYFNGVDDYVYTPEELEIQGREDYTVSVLVKPEILSGAAKIIFGDAYFYFGIAGWNQNRVVYGIHEGLEWYELFGSSSSDIAVDKWAHLAITHENGVGRKIYVNGNLDAQDSYSHIADWGHGPSIGARASDGVWFFQGNIDEFRLYNRSLSDAEIGDLYDCYIGPREPSDEYEFNFTDLACNNNSICDGLETYQTCVDCSMEDEDNYCSSESGDGVCDPDCIFDSDCLNNCGDGTCDENETSQSCSEDCPIEDYLNFTIPTLSCADQGGDICVGSEYCPGEKLEAKDSSRCCNETCAEISPQVCAGCGLGVFNLFCDRQECEAIPEGCYFIDTGVTGFGGNCSACSGAGCFDYNGDEQTCLSDVCGLGNCNYDFTCYEQAECVDVDLDGYSLPSRGCGVMDCNDSNSEANPGKREICNDGFDNDCDGLIDCFDLGSCENYQGCIVSANLPKVKFENPTPVDFEQVLEAGINVSIVQGDLPIGDVSWKLGESSFKFLDDSLVAYWQFDNNPELGDTDILAVDISRYSNNGTIIGAVWNQSGKYGGAMSFDGLGDYVEVSRSGAPFNFSNNKDFTASAWVKLDPGNSKNGRIVSKRITGGGSVGFEMAWVDSVNSWYFMIADSVAVRSANTYAEGVWQYVLMTRGGSTCYIYVNGVLDNSSSCSLNADSMTNLTIGMGSAAYFNGTIDEVRIYNRSLSADEIWQHYQSNLKKINDSYWELYSDQGDLSSGMYSHKACVEDVGGNEDCTELRNLNLMWKGCTLDSECVDDYWCNGDESCVDGTCQYSPVERCEDSLSCTVDICDEILNSCENTETDEDEDGFSVCEGPEKDCDDRDSWVFPTALEICDGLDNNCDNQIDEDEVCDLSLEVNNSYYDGDTSNFTTENLSNFNLVLEKVDYGKIVYYENISIGFSLRDIYGPTNISYNYAYVNSSYIFFSYPAIIALRGLTLENPRLLKDGMPCGDSCKLLSYNKGALVFEVGGFSAYSAEETPVANDDVSDDDSGGSGGGGGGGGFPPGNQTVEPEGEPEELGTEGLECEPFVCDSENKRHCSEEGAWISFGYCDNCEDEICEEDRCGNSMCERYLDETALSCLKDCKKDLIIPGVIALIAVIVAIVILRFATGKGVGGSGGMMLRSYVGEALGKGYSKQQIRGELIKKKWPRKTVDKVLKDVKR